MGKDKLRRFNEMKSFERLFQPSVADISGKDYYLKNKWAEEVFQNNNKVILELGCGKGEYTVGLARKFPGTNFIGIDIKGARMWKGSKIANDDKLCNAAFLRTRIEFINSYFGEDEISEIWIPFPDPQLKERRQKNRLTGKVFLDRYRNFLTDRGIIHLKTDNKVLYEDTRELLSYNNLEIIYYTEDLYNEGISDASTEIRTFYESQYLVLGLPIHYLRFRLPKNIIINDIPGKI